MTWFAQVALYTAWNNAVYHDLRRRSCTSRRNVDSLVQLDVAFVKPAALRHQQQIV
jgi:hypothetical protein